jgi:hypothetical protein
MTDETAGVVDKNGEGPGVNRVGRVGIAVVTTYLLGLSAALLYCLIILWPHPGSPEAGPAGETKAGFQQVADPSPGSGGHDPRPGAVANPNEATARVQQPDSSAVRFVVWNFRLDEEACFC